MQLNKQNYFSSEADVYYMSVSQFKSFDLQHGGCEAKAVAKLKGEWTENNDAFLLGSYVHSWNEGTLEEFKQEHPELYSSKGPTKGQLLAKYALGDKMIETLKNDELISKVREGQKEVVMTAELFGVPWKIMIDIYNPNKTSFADLKTTREIYKRYWNEEQRQFQNFIQYYDYLLQMAVYAEVERINRNADDYLSPHIIAVSKEENPDKAVIFMGTDYIQDKLFEIELKLPHILEVKNGHVEPIRCEECDYCRTTKKLRTIINFKDL